MGPRPRLGIHTPFALTRYDLDALGLDRPVIVAHFSFHQCVVSSLGLERLGISRATPDPPGGEIERDRSGDATGMLRERAWGRAHAASLAAYAEPNRWDELILARMRALLAHGVTAVHDAACPPAAEAAYQPARGGTHRACGARPTLPDAWVANSPAQVRALAELGAVAVVQPGFVETAGRRVGHMRFDDAAWMPFADLADAGVTLAASSDHPSGSASPLTTSRLAAVGGAPRDLAAGSHQPLPLHDWLRPGRSARPPRADRSTNAAASHLESAPTWWSLMVPPRTLPPTSPRPGSRAADATTATTATLRRQ